MDKMKYSILDFCIIFAAVCFFAVFSMGSRAATPINISGTIMAPPPCVINGEKTIMVDFGENVVISRIDGSNYLTTIKYTLECKEQTKNAMKLMIAGTAAGFNSDLIQTFRTDLGIALKQNGQPLRVNQWMNFNYPAQPVLQAVPVKKPGADLPTGGFFAGATLKVDYQ
ncbi:putative minor fimbrial subunit StfF [Serratia quinivorans]|uniref:MrfE protein n=1 Tax=Serratia proteamaculans (strain 568) TaxID=399741 RepID=A8GL22_SERP5|nr:fimbrial protein [Serratia quinivorans]CAI1174358.1 putative minor fimbrial subunit StfF [Serratia quinivorans]